VWAARNERFHLSLTFMMNGLQIRKEQQYVTVKIEISDLKMRDRKIQIVGALAELPTNHPEFWCIMTMVDHFQLKALMALTTVSCLSHWEKMFPT
jgi:hypothetical protein